MSDRPLLAGLRDELIRLAELVVAANARVDTVGSQLREGSGSAWLYADCLWVTNHHVVGEARGKVTLSRGAQRIFGDVLGKDADTDLAVIRAAEPIQAKPLILRQDPARLGELCFAIGAPLGHFADSMSMGMVSGLNRRLARDDGRYIEDVLQTDAAINPGNSGGPLVDIDGCVLGVNTAMRADATSIGFAVPSHTVAEIVPELIETGMISRASIGAQIEIRRSHISSADDIAILKTIDDSPLRPGDLLRELNGRAIRRREDLTRALRRDLIDREVAVVIERDGTTLTISITPTRRLK